MYLLPLWQHSDVYLLKMEYHPSTSKTKTVETCIKKNVNTDTVKQPHVGKSLLLLGLIHCWGGVGRGGPGACPWPRKCWISDLLVYSWGKIAKVGQLL